MEKKSKWGKVKTASKMMSSVRGFQSAADKAFHELRDKQQEIQSKTFMRWANHHLQERELEMEDLSEGLKDGVMLINLLEIISGEEGAFPRYNKKPRIRLQQTENIQKCLQFLHGAGIRTVNIGAPDIQEGNIVLILGLMWTIILRFQIADGGDDGGAKNALLEWVNSMIAPQGKSIRNFHKDWQSGDILCALLNAIVDDGVIPTGDAVTDIENAMDAANMILRIPRVLDAADMANYPDEMSIMTYVAYFREAAFRDLPCDPNMSFADGPGITDPVIAKQGDPSYHRNLVKVNVRSANDKPATFESYNVQIVDPNGDILNFDLKSSSNKELKFEYHPNMIGPHTLHVQLDESYIDSMPMLLNVGYGKDAADASKCFNQECSFTITAHRPNGQAKTRGGDRVELRVTEMTRRKEMDCQARDNNDGTYTCSYTLEASPAHKSVWRVAVWLNGHPLPGTPFFHDMTKGMLRS